MDLVILQKERAYKTASSKTALSKAALSSTALLSRADKKNINETYKMPQPLLNSQPLLNPLYAFDLDSTITSAEILPFLAQELDLFKELELLTQLTLDGVLDFESSLKLRFHLLKSLPLKRVHEIVAEIPLNPDIYSFIKRKKDRAVVITGNVDCWIVPIKKKLGCRFFSSHTHRQAGQLKLLSIMDKKDAMQDLLLTEKNIITVGDSANDIPMFRMARVSVAFGGVTVLKDELKALADFVVYDGAALCELLDKL